MPTTHNHLICFLGRNGSGKSYRANQLVKEQNYIKISMADALRELAWKSLGWRPKDDEEYNLFKFSKISLLNRGNYNIEDLTGITIQEYHSIAGRQYLQNLGQGCKDLFGEDFWVKQWEKKILSIKANAQDVCENDLLLELKKDSKYEINNYTIDHVGLNFINVNKNSVALKEEDEGYLAYIHPDSDILNKYLKQFNSLINITTDDIRFPIEIEAAHKLGATFIWCDHLNGDYPKEENPSEALANKILASGKYKDGDEISFEDLKTFFN